MSIIVMDLLSSSFVWSLGANSLFPLSSKLGFIKRLWLVAKEYYDGEMNLNTIGFADKYKAGLWFLLYMDYSIRSPKCLFEGCVICLRFDHMKGALLMGSKF